jgi:hypothetical protein
MRIVQYKQNVENESESLESSLLSQSKESPSDET